jgi:hypothetical protein
LVPEDDMFHPPPTDDPWWTETVWYGWMVPERRMLGYFYLVYRANQHLQFGGVLLLDEHAVAPWELPFFEYDWHLPLTEWPDLTNADDLLRGDMWLRCIEHGRRFEFGYDRDDLRIDLRWDALMQPLLTRQAPPYDLGSHVDQLGHVTGTMTLYGEAIPVDCFAMRDRSWGLRRNGPQAKVGYCYGTQSADDAFLAISVDRRQPDGTRRDGITGGFLMRDGVWSLLADGTRSVTRDEEGRPATVVIDAVDQLGRPLVATGSTVSRQVFLAYPSMFCWNSLAQWRWGADETAGCSGWGEDQDIWHPRRWRDHARALRRAPVPPPVNRR